MKLKTLFEEIHKEFGRFQTPTYNFKHLRSLELKVDKVLEEFIKNLKNLFFSEQHKGFIKEIDKLAGEELSK